MRKYFVLSFFYFFKVFPAGSEALPAGSKPLLTSTEVRPAGSKALYLSFVMVIISYVYEAATIKLTVIQHY